MPSSVQKRQPRLKESCDHCSAAKVRCTKEKPCSRCSSKGFDCTYSHSRRAGRRNMTSSLNSNSPRIGRTPSVTSSLPESQESPESSDDSNSDVFDLWTNQNTSTGNDFIQPLWDEEMYGLQTTPFDQAAQMTYAPAAQMLPNGTLINSPHTFQGIPITPFDDATADLLNAPIMSRASSSGTVSTQDSYNSRSSISSVQSHHADAVHDELANLTNFAEAMEKKFDAVVKTRLQYRDVYSEFGIPVDELETGSKRLDGVTGQQGFVPAPDASELAFYYSLAEMKRRLKWLREDFGTMMSQPV